eukprot:Gb_06390 [translate_table: standard]
MPSNTYGLNARIQHRTSPLFNIFHRSTKRVKVLSTGVQRYQYYLMNQKGLTGFRTVDYLEKVLSAQGFGFFLVAMDLPENENATKEGDEISSTELEEETCVRIKKKSRRVSFAEITSVHVFDRDEDYETPPDIKPNSGGASHRTPTGGSPRPYLKLLHDEDSAHRLHLTPTSSLDGCSLQANGFEHSVPEGDTPCSVSDRGTPDEGQF